MCGTPNYLAPEVVTEGVRARGYDHIVASGSVGINRSRCASLFFRGSDWIVYDSRLEDTDDCEDALYDKDMDPAASGTLHG